MYCVQDSQASENLKKGLGYLNQFIVNKPSLPQDPDIHLAPSRSYDELKKFTYFMKHGDSYDEREWRFVPQNSEEFVIPTENQRERLMSFIKGLNKTSPFPEFLNFQSQDVKYIIVKSSGEIDEVVTFLSKLRKFDARSRNFLKTRLLTSMDILEDFYKRAESNRKAQGN